MYRQQAEYIKVIEKNVWDPELIKAIVNFLAFPEAIH